MSEGARYNRVQFEVAHKYVFDTKLVPGQEAEITEATINHACEQRAHAFHPGKGVDAVNCATCAKVEVSRNMLIHIIKFGLRQYHCSELEWAKDQLGFAPNYKGVVVTEDKVTRAFETKMMGLTGQNDKLVWSYSVANSVLGDIASTGVMNIWLDPFDQRLSFPSECFE